VHLRDLGAADGRPAQPGLVDQPPGRLPGRVLEKRAGVGEPDLLRVPALLQAALHGRGDRLAGAGCKLKIGRNYNFIRFKLQAAITVIQAFFVLNQKSVLAQNFKRNEVVECFTAMGAGVHPYCAADRAGNADQKLQAAQAVGLGQAGQVDVAPSGLGPDYPPRSYGEVMDLLQ